MPSTRDMIVTTGITTPVAALSFVVKPSEVFPAAGLIVGLEVIFEAEDTNVLEGNGSVEIVDSGKDETLATGTGFTLQAEKAR